MRGDLRLVGAGLLATLLAALCLGATFDSAGWVPVTGLAALAAVAGCEAGRRMSAPRAVVPVFGLIALVWFLLLAFAGDLLTLGVVPDPDSVARLVALVGEGSEDLQKYAAPIAPMPTMRFFAAGGVGLVAVAVDTAAVTYGRAALAGLPLLALYAVPAAVVPGGISWGRFAVGAVGYLGLLLAESHERVGRWGRPLGARPGTPTGARPLAAVGRRVGGAAIGLAVVLPALVPGLTEGVLGTGSGIGGGTGQGRRTIEVGNPILEMQDDLRTPSSQEILTYRTNDPTPGYIRTVGLDLFDGNAWNHSQLNVPRERTVNAGIAAPDGLSARVARSTARTEFQISEQYDSRWLPLPYPAQRVAIEGTWLYDQATSNVFGAPGSTASLGYSVEHLLLAPTPALLRAAPQASSDFDRFRAVPADFRPVLARTLDRVTAGADTDYDRALAIQNWLRDFSYDEAAPEGTGVANVESFLRRRSGYCVHFASMMTLLARQLGIPARVGVGLQEGTPRGDGSWSVALNDAHAWPELYFEGAGWVPFEPTPAQRADAPAYARESRGPGATSTAPASTPGSTASTSASSRRPGSDAREAASSAVTAQADEGFRVPWRVLLVGAAVLGILLSPAAARLAVRRRRFARAGDPRLLAEAAWAEVRDVAVDYGHERADSETPRQFAGRLSAAAGLREGERDALGRLATAAERSRYARAVGTVGDLRADTGTVRGGLAARAGRARRLRAGLAPASLLSLVHLAGERVADGLDGLDGLSARARARLSRGGRRGRR